MVSSLDYGGITFLVSKKAYSKIEQKNNICIDVFRYDQDLVYPVNLSDEKCEDHMDLMQITNGNNSLYVYIKDFNRFMCSKKKRWTKKPFADIICSILVVKKYW